MRSPRSSRATRERYQPAVLGSSETSATTTPLGVPVELPHAHARRSDLRDTAGREIDLEQAAARLARPNDRWVGRRFGAAHGPRTPVEAVAAGVGREHQEAVARARPRDRLRRPSQGGRKRGFGVENHGERELVARGDPIGEERQPRSVRRPRWDAIAPHAARDPDGHVGVAVDEKEVARWVRADVRDRGVERERHLRPVGRERELRRRPNVEQALVDRAVELWGCSHGASA